MNEPVSESAAMARRKAAELCRAAQPGQEDCSWYHGMWQYLRLFGVVPTPERHARFYRDTLGSLARDGQYSRILIPGVADYAMLAHLLRAYRDGGEIPRVTVVDRCETPLFLCRWYAERQSVTVDTRATDILEYDPLDHFDVVCTHSLLSHFPLSRKKDLITVWRRALRTGGKVATNLRVVPSPEEDPPGYTPDQVVAFRDRVFQEALKRREALGIDPEQMARHAQRYAERIKTYSFRSREEIIALFEAGGFAVERLKPIELSRAGRSDPRTNRFATYMEIVASRL